MLQLYNTLTREKRNFRRIDKRKKVRMYVCGPTVYDLIHVGNARPIVVFDVLFRILIHKYGRANVSYARNITDIDDKINNRAFELGESISELTERTIHDFHTDVRELGSLNPDFEPRATDHVKEMLRMIKKLLTLGVAYRENGHVLYSVRSAPSSKPRFVYGKLSRKNRGEIVHGARVEVAPYKRDPADFVLWKPSTDEQPGWDSPWGRGRPGWHIECSAMSKEYLGTPFEIHGGGLDLIFPHHENEIAQSCRAENVSRMARYWVHNGYVEAEGQKMSKSLDNFYTVRQLLTEGHSGEAIRLLLLKTHYRKPLDFTLSGLIEAKEDLNYFYTALKKVDHLKLSSDVNPDEDVYAALLDDINTPIALRRMHNHAAILNRMIDSRAREDELVETASRLKADGNLLGVLLHEPNDWRRGRVFYEEAKFNVSQNMVSAAPGTAQLKIRGHQPDVLERSSEEFVEVKIAERAEAKKIRNFVLADQIRDELLEEGIILEDKSDGTTEWRFDATVKIRGLTSTAEVGDVKVKIGSTDDD